MSTDQTLTLTTGRLVRVTLMPAGHYEVMAVDGGDLTQAEWDEYCAYNLRRAREQNAARRVGIPKCATCWRFKRDCVCA